MEESLCQDRTAFIWRLPNLPTAVWFCLAATFTTKQLNGGGGGEKFGNVSVVEGWKVIPANSPCHAELSRCQNTGWFRPNQAQSSWHSDDAACIDRGGSCSDKLPFK